MSDQITCYIPTEHLVEVEALRAERDRLREALETIAATGPMLTAEEASDIARAALKEGDCVLR